MRTQLQPAPFTIRGTAQLLHGVTYEVPSAGSAEADQLAFQHQTAQAVYSAQEATAEAMKRAVYRALERAGIAPDPFAAVRGPYVDARG